MNTLKKIREERLSKKNESRKPQFENGDKIKVVSGEFKGEIGTIDLIMSETYIIKLSENELIEVDKDTIELY